MTDVATDGKASDMYTIDVKNRVIILIINHHQCTLDVGNFTFNKNWMHEVNSYLRSIFPGPLGYAAVVDVDANNQSVNGRVWMSLRPVTIANG